MSIIFDMTVADPGDPGGWGVWLNSHYLEHQQFVQKAQLSAPGTQMELYDLGLWPLEGGTDWWVDAHYAMHQSLETASGISAPDMQAVDFTDPESWGIFLDLNAQHHAAIRQHYGIT